MRETDKVALNHLFPKLNPVQNGKGPQILHEVPGDLPFADFLVDYHDMTNLLRDFHKKANEGTNKGIKLQMAVVPPADGKQGGIAVWRVK